MGNSEIVCAGSGGDESRTRNAWLAPELEVVCRFQYPVRCRFERGIGNGDTLDKQATGRAFAL